MHPLRVTLLVSLGIAAAVAFAFGEALLRAGATPAEAHVLSFAVFVAFMVPWSAVSLWAFRRAEDFDLLVERTRRVAAGDYQRPIGERRYHAEVDDLARGIEELRAALLRERASFEEHRESMERIVASLGEGLLAVNGRGKVVFANDVVAQLFGASGPLVGKSFLEAVRRQVVVDAVDRATRGEATVERINVDARQIEIRAFPVAPSAEIAAVALFIDVTEIERLQRVRQEFLDDFSHEVRTPLAGLRSAAESFEHRGLTDEQEEHLRRIILRQLARIERLVRDLSELSRIESGELVLERAPVDLTELVRELCADAAERFERPIVVRADDAVMANVDRVRVQQIVSNLVDNAYKHGRRGTIDVEVAREGSDAIVRVSDEGEGIPPHEIERIFNRFYRVDKSRSQETPGVGLGLAITKHLVLLHGGAIRAYNRPEGGAGFEVRFHGL